jgi:hypothetical protein
LQPASGALKFHAAGGNQSPYERKRDTVALGFRRANRWLITLVLDGKVQRPSADSSRGRGNQLWKRVYMKKI